VVLGGPRNVHRCTLLCPLNLIHNMYILASPHWRPRPEVAIRSVLEGERKSRGREVEGEEGKARSYPSFIGCYWPGFGHYYLEF